ncbi:hypothetical protein ACH5RR_026531 [Cinchona calisaya]|uniref:Uncharacterized protein n=1 Tax=Cinchona calisaya TaxID=153742 RepID=A0ABD2Z3Y8_9GENT
MRRFLVAQLLLCLLVILGLSGPSLADTVNIDWSNRAWLAQVSVTTYQAQDTFEFQNTPSGGIYELDLTSYTTCTLGDGPTYGANSYTPGGAAVAYFAGEACAEGDKVVILTT